VQEQFEEMLAYHIIEEPYSYVNPLNLVQRDEKVSGCFDTEEANKFIIPKTRCIQCKCSCRDFMGL